MTDNNTTETQNVNFPPKPAPPDMNVVMADLVKAADEVRKVNNLSLEDSQDVIVVPFRSETDMPMNTPEYVEALKDKLNVKNVEVSEIDDDRFVYSVKLNKQAMIDHGKEADYPALAADMDEGLQDVFVKAMYEYLNEDGWIEFQDKLLIPGEMDFTIKAANNDMIGMETPYAGLYFIKKS